MKTVVITGAAKGIGFAAAKKFLSADWRVIGTYLNTPVPIDDPNIATVQYDQGDPAKISKTAKEILKLTPRIDALVNCAGILVDGLDETADAAKVRRTLEVNVVGLIDITERLLPNMGKGSHVVNLDSGYGSFAVPIDDETSAGYRISKAALNMYTRHLAFRLKEKGVIVSSLAPGWVNTHMGNIIADETSKPDREPSEAAEDIYDLVMNVTESGQFWEYGKKISW